MEQKPPKLVPSIFDKSNTKIELPARLPVKRALTKKILVFPKLPKLEGNK